MHNKSQQRLIKVFADSIPRKTGIGLFIILLILMGGVYLLALFFVPEVFQALEAGKDCMFSGPDGSSQASGCNILDLSKSKVWEGHLTRMNATNVFLTIEGVTTRKSDTLEAGSIIRSLR